MSGRPYIAVVLLSHCFCKGTAWGVTTRTCAVIAYVTFRATAYGLYGLIIFAIAPLVVSHGIIGLILSVIMIVRFVKAVKLNVEYAEYKKRIQ